jgi:hypothetical protein
MIDRQAGTEQDQTLSLNIAKSAPTIAVVLYLWLAGDSAGARHEFEATELAKILRPPYLMYQ